MSIRACLSPQSLVLIPLLDVWGPRGQKMNHVKQARLFCRNLGETNTSRQTRWCHIDYSSALLHVLYTCSSTCIAYKNAYSSTSIAQEEMYVQKWDKGENKMCVCLCVGIGSNPAFSVTP